MKDLAYTIKTLLALIGIPKTTIQMMGGGGSGVRSYQRLGLGLLLAAFALTPNCPGSDSSNGSEDPPGSTTNFTLTVTPPTNGSIAVVGTPEDETCNSAVSPTAGDCTYTLADGTMVTLTATADMGYEFTSWGGDCSGSAICTLTMDADKMASAVFEMNRTLTVTPPANGSIAVGAPLNMTCNSGDSSCTYSAIPDGTMVTLTATADRDYEFTSWGDDCSGSSTCTLTMDQDRTASAQFLPAGTPTRMLTVTPLTNGSIEVAYPSFTATCSSGAGECPYTIPKDTVVTLTATGDTGYEFTSWGDDCSGMSGNTCTLTMSENRTASATFTSTLRTLTVTPPTNGSIAVGAPVDMTCNSRDSAPSCIYLIPDRTMVTLTATGEIGYAFDSWSTCPDTESGNTCTLTMDADKTASAAFSMFCEPTSADLDCDEDGTNNGDDAFPDNADVQDAIALFSPGRTDGGFGFTACDTFLDSDTSLRAMDMRNRGFRTARFYGSTPDYDFPDLHTNDEGLALASAEVSLPVAAFMDDGTTSSHSFPVSGTTRITIADLVAVDSGGVWTTPNLFANALDPIISDSFNRFWSFTNNRVYDASRSCSGATSMNVLVFGVRGDQDAIDGSAGLGTGAGGCNTFHDVLCVARR